MYAYEGLGSIYWHMVSKLLLAALENFQKAVEQGADPVTIGKLADCYFDIRAGIGFNKTPDNYGALPLQILTPIRQALLVPNSRV